MHVSIVALVLTKALLTGVCSALNVTVQPGPVVMAMQSDNLTLSCLVSQRKRTSGVLVLRWFFSPPAATTTATTTATTATTTSLNPSPPPPFSPPPPPPPPPPPTTTEVLIVRMGIKRMKQYGNYTRRFPEQPNKFRLQEERPGEVYRLLIANVTTADQGVYTCRVQEIRRHRNTWRASSNGTGATTLTVRLTLEEDSREGVLRIFSDLYLSAVILCSLGLLSIFLFTLVLGCQHLLRRNRSLKASYLLVKCPESSSGETVTGSTCSSSPSPPTPRKESMRSPHSNARPQPKPRLKPKPRPAAQMPPRPGEDDGEEEPPLPPPPPPQHLLTKVPVAAQRLRKPRRLKNHARRSTPQRDYYQEDSLTYAELELVRPRPDRPVSSPTGLAETTTTTATNPTPTSTITSITSTTASSTIITTMDTNADTVYAQILFQEKQL